MWLRCRCDRTFEPFDWFGFFSGAHLAGVVDFLLVVSRDIHECLAVAIRARVDSLSTPLPVVELIISLGHFCPEKK